MNNRREYFRLNKAIWGEGPWLGEPDKVQFTDPETGYPCLVNRGPMGALCGYVGVPEGHPLYGRPYGDVDADVHGGLTFSAPCSHEEDPAKGICHIPEPGEPDNVWWFGFDCAHAFDLMPDMLRLRKEIPALQELAEKLTPSEFQDVYRTLEYVETQIVELAKQLKEAEGK